MGYVRQAIEHISENTLQLRHLACILITSTISLNPPIRNPFGELFRRCASRLKQMEEIQPASLIIAAVAMFMVSFSAVDSVEISPPALAHPLKLWWKEILEGALCSNGTIFTWWGILSTVAKIASFNWDIKSLDNVHQGPFLSGALLVCSKWSHCGDPWGHSSCPLHTQLAYDKAYHMLQQ